ncbi:MAG: ABC transporter substrate-binding protein [Calditrichaeota bacterium]|nr:ABC transporter substrate-binding protein [Calditrichota bacterium]
MNKRVLPYLYLFLSLLLMLGLFQLQRFWKIEKPTEVFVPRKNGQDTLVFLSGPDKKNLFPYEATYDEEIFLINQIYQGLVKLDHQMREVPDLARYWEISPDFKTYTFYLPRDHTFHNGQPLTADDVEISLRYYLRHYQQNYLFPYFLVIKGAREFSEGRTDRLPGVEKVSPYIIRFHLEKPFLPFLKLLSVAEAKILPGGLLRTNPDYLKAHPIGSGPYMVKRITDSTIFMEAARWDPRSQTPPFVRFLKIVYGREATMKRLHGFRFQLTNYFYLVSEEGRMEFNELRLSTLTTIFLGLNCQLFPTNKVSFRKALLYALPREKIAEKYTEQLAAADYFCPLNLPRDTAHVHLPDVDLSKARSWMETFRKHDGVDSMPTVRLAIDTTLYSPDFLEVITESLKRLGVPYQVTYYQGLTWKEEVEYLKQFHMFLLGWTLDLPDPQFYFDVFFNSLQMNNIMQYRNPEVDLLLRLANETFQIKKRLKYYVQIEEILRKEVPIIPIQENYENIFYKKYVKNILMNQIGISSLDLSQLWIDINLKRQIEKALK